MADEESDSNDSLQNLPGRPERNEDFDTDQTDPPQSLVDQFSKMSMNQDVLPKGFRTSVLFDLALKDSQYTMGNFMSPKLEEPGISFKDIRYEKNLLRSNAALLQKKISLVAARQIPEPPSDFIVKSRHIRMCFHNGNKVLSNIHFVKAKWSKSDPKLWMFNTKLTSKDSCIEEGEIFIKCNECVPTLGILFELCISYEHLKETGEMCSGWAFMKMLNDLGEPVKSTTNILKVQDTEPFTACYPSANSQGIAAFFKKIKDKQKLPRIVISICDPDRPSNQQISYLPSCLIGPWSCISILSLLRKVTAEDLLERSSFDSAERILSPVLASLPRVLNEPDLLDALRVSWTSIMKNINTDDIRKTFRRVFCETVFVIANCNNLMPFKLGDSESENARKSAIQRIQNIQDGQEQTLFLSEELEFMPLSLNRISANIINLNKGVLNGDIHFVADNPGKISEAEEIMKSNNIKVKFMRLDLPEYQGEPNFISEAKCKCAASIVKGPVIIEDTSLAFDALHGLPGPYIKWFLDKLGPDGLYKLLSGFEDKSASAICTLGFSEGPGKPVLLFQGVTRGKIVRPKGNKDVGWDSCFLPEGKDKTLNELNFEEKKTFSQRRKALHFLKDYLTQRSKS